jgi:hypothetical protein
VLVSQGCTPKCWGKTLLYWFMYKEGRSESRQANYLYSCVLLCRDSVAFSFLVYLAKIMLWSHDSLCSHTSSSFIVIRNQSTSLVLSTFFLCTHPFTCTPSWLVLISFLKALFRVNFVIILARLFFLLIYWISVIFLCLYNCRSAIILIIRRFFYVILSLTKYLYNKYKLVQTTIKVYKNLSCLVIILIIMLIIIVISIPLTML